MLGAVLMDGATLFAATASEHSHGNSCAKALAGATKTYEVVNIGNVLASI